MWETSRSNSYQHIDRVDFSGQINKAGISSAPMAPHGSGNLVDENNFPV